MGRVNALKIEEGKRAAVTKAKFGLPVNHERGGTAPVKIKKLQRVLPSSSKGVQNTRKNVC